MDHRARHQKATVQRALLASADFLTSYLPLINAHAVNFIVKDAWNSVLPPAIQCELLALSEQQLYQLPAGCICLGRCLCSNQLEKETESCSQSAARKHLEAELHGNASIKADCGSLQHAHKHCQVVCGTDELGPKGGSRLLRGTELDDRSMSVGWKHNSLREFLTGVREHCVDRLLSLDESMNSLSAWLNGKPAGEQETGNTVPFLHFFMNEKKMHEVEVMGELCARLFDRSSADVVVDVGSGKGYLSTHLTLHHRLSVIGIDSQPHNTLGAVQRMAKLEKQWDSLVKLEQKRLLQKDKVQLRKDKVQLQKDKAQLQKEEIQLQKEEVQLQEIQQGIAEKCCISIDWSCGVVKEQSVCCQYGRSDGVDVCEHSLHGADVCDKHNLHGVDVCDEHSLHQSSQSQTSQCEPGTLGIEFESGPCRKSNKSVKDVTKSKDIQETDPKSAPRQGEKQNSRFQSSLVFPDKREGSSSEGFRKKEMQTEIENQSTQSKSTSRHDASTDRQINQSKSGSSKHVAVTVFVNPDTRLTDLVADSLSILCPEPKPAGDVRLLLTGLHTCGPLASSMLRLCVKDESVRALCSVGCCYQLMQERFLGESGEWPPQLQGCPVSAASWAVGDDKEGDFPLSSVMQERRMVIGRTALNIASLAPPRMTRSIGELQGKTYYPRALLQAFIHSKLGYVPQGLKKLRNLGRQASGPVDYVRRALQKWNIPGCEATDEEILQFHTQHMYAERRMAAFFQVVAALAPVVETVVLLDRVLYLLEQDCVQHAFLLRLFDPVTSPRCHAIVACKKEPPHHL